HRQPQIMSAARWAHGPGVVAKVALERSKDGGGRVGRRPDTPRRIEAVDCLDEGKARDLVDIVLRLCAPRTEALRQLEGQRHMAQHEALAQLRSACAGVLAVDLVKRVGPPPRRSLDSEAHRARPPGRSAAAASSTTYIVAD